IAGSFVVFSAFCLGNAKLERAKIALESPRFFFIAGVPPFPLYTRSLILRSQKWQLLELRTYGLNALLQRWQLWGEHPPKKGARRSLGESHCVQCGEFFQNRKILNAQKLRHQSPVFFPEFYL